MININIIYYYYVYKYINVGILKRFYLIKPTVLSLTCSRKNRTSPFPTEKGLNSFP